jgi:acetyl esterase
VGKESRGPPHGCPCSTTRALSLITTRGVRHAAPNVSPPNLETLPMNAPRHDIMHSRRAILAGLGGLALAGVGAMLLPQRTTAQATPILGSPVVATPVGRYPIQVRDVVYRQDGTQQWLARVYQPQGQGPFPTLLDVHGGIWNFLDRSYEGLMNVALAANGMVVVAIDYRLAPQYPYPASVADVNYATRWLKAHTDDFNGQATHVGGFGASAGGHLVMLSAMRPHDPRYAALPLPDAPDVDATLAYLLLAWPILDPYARYQFAQQTQRDDLIKAQDAYFGTTAVMQEANPQLILDRGEQVDLPPTIIIQGAADKNVTPAMQERFAATYHKAGGVLELDEFANESHYFANAPGTDTERALQLLEAFASRYDGA